MALVACKECGKEVSKSAAACPHCGYKPKRTSLLTWIITIFLGVPFLLAVVTSAINSSSTSTRQASQPTAPAAQRTATGRPAKCEYGSPVSGRFYPQGSGINFRSGPGEEYDRVVNQKLSRVVKRTEYRTLDRAVVLQGLCETEDWLQGKIVLADGYPVDWETGWVSKDYVSGEQSDDQAAGLLWDIDRESAFTAEEKRLVRQGALKVLADESNCKEIVTGYRSDSRQGAYYVTCNAANGGPGFNVWFTPEDLERKASLGVPTAYPETESRMACRSAIEASTLHPSTLDIHDVLGYATEVHNNGNRTVIQEFTAQNSFGTELKYRARCLIQPNGKVEITMAEVP